MKYASLIIVGVTLGLLSGCSEPDTQVGIAETPPGVQGVEALLYAVKGGDLETVKPFVEGNPEILLETDHQGNTLLHIAGAYNRLNVVEYLIQQGANPAVQNYEGLDCFEYADMENADRAVLDLMRP